ncbi:MAG: M24 family metallopeptidase, partial [Deltaproteobacteria bacterium]|nr:M24 family metallopeptidase [Deltaproteobacteria bacterium]
EPTAEQERVYRTLFKAQETGFTALGGNSPPSPFQLDRIVREVLTEAGLEKAFSHGTGHGIGLEIHEAPSISPAAGNEPLEAGMVFTIEPGCYFPNRWGIRIEDTIHLTEEGPVKLTTIDKNLERMIIS